MKAMKITLNDIKGVSALMSEVDELKERSYSVCGYGSNYSGKEALIDSKEATIQKNVTIIANVLNVDYDIVIDMCFDHFFAKEVLNDIYN